MKNNDHTLVILTPGFPESESPSYLVLSQQLMVKALKKNFPHLHIIVLSFLYPHNTTYYWHGAEVISFDGMRRGGLKRLFLWRQLWKTLKKIRREHTIIGLFSFWCGECAFWAKYFGKKYRIKHYSWISGQDARKTNKWIPFIRPCSAELVAMSYSLANEFYKNHGVKPHAIIPNALDPSLFRPIMAPERNIDVLGAGSLEPLKQYDLFTRIIASLRKNFPAIKAYHCGTGKEQKKIERLIGELKLENSFSLLGGVSHTELLELMQHSKVFLHTSNYEGFSTVCLEALYAGAQVISFCYPLEHPVPHWHVVSTREEMEAKARDILQDPATDYSPVFLYSMDDSAKAVMELFVRSETSNVRRQM